MSMSMSQIGLMAGPVRTFNQLTQYANITCWYAELAVAMTHYTYPQRDGQAELAWMA